MGYLVRLMKTGSGVDAKLKESTDRQLRKPSAVPMMHGGLGMMHRGRRPCTLCTTLKLDLGLGLGLDWSHGVYRISGAHCSGIVLSRPIVNEIIVSPEGNEQCN